MIGGTVVIVGGLGNDIIWCFLVRCLIVLLMFCVYVMFLVDRLI